MKINTEWNSFRHEGTIKFTAPCVRFAKAGSSCIVHCYYPAAPEELSVKANQENPNICPEYVAYYFDIHDYLYNLNIFLLV
jgi:hypothetical protein